MTNELCYRVDRSTGTVLSSRPPFNDLSIPPITELRREFEQAAEDVQRLDERPDNDTLLRLYALYKQGLEGDVHGPQPGFFDFVGTAKYEAWAKFRGLDQSEAQRRYVQLVRDLLV